MEKNGNTYWTEERKQEAIDFILKEISEERKSLVGVIRDSKAKGEIKLPNPPLFYDWLKNDEDLENKYAHACNIRADALFEEILDIADDGSNDTYIHPQTGNELENKEITARSKIRISARQWMISKMNPKKYGDSQRMELSGTVEVKQPNQYILKPANGSEEDKGDTN